MTTAQHSTTAYPPECPSEYPPECPPINMAELQKAAIKPVPFDMAWLPGIRDELIGELQKLRFGSFYITTSTAEDISQEVCAWVIDQSNTGKLDTKFWEYDQDGWFKLFWQRAYWLAKDTAKRARKLSYPASRYYDTLQSFGDAVEVQQDWEDTPGDTGQRQAAWTFTVNPEKRILEEDLGKKLWSYLRQTDPKGATWLYRSYILGLSQSSLAQKEGLSIRAIEKRLAKMRALAWEWLTDERRGGCPELRNRDRLSNLRGTESQSAIVRQTLRRLTHLDGSQAA